MTWLTCGRLHVIFKRSLPGKFLFSPRSWELSGRFSCGNVIQTAFVFCVPDHCSLHLLGRKITRWRTISDYLSLVYFEQLERRVGEVQSTCRWNFIFFFTLIKIFFLGDMWNTTNTLSCAETGGLAGGGSSECYCYYLAIWRSAWFLINFAELKEKAPFS